MLQSASNVDNFYEVDVTALTCSCPSFINDHSSFMSDDPRRLCKHLIRIFIEKNILPPYFFFYKEEIERLAQIKKGFNHNEKIQTSIENERVEAFIPTFEDIKTSWITLFYKDHSYRYNPLTKQWVSNRSPQNKENILKWLRSENKKIISNIDLDNIFRGKQKPIKINEGIEIDIKIS